MPIIGELATGHTRPGLTATGLITMSSEADPDLAHIYGAEGDLIFTGLAMPSVARPATAEGDIQFSALANGHIDDDPDTEGTAEGQIQFSSLAIPTTFLGRFAFGDIEFSSSAEPTINIPVAFRLSVWLDIYDVEITQGKYIFDQPRLKVDGTEIPIVSWDFDEGEDSATATLSVVLAQPSDAPAFTSESSIDFGIGRKHIVTGSLVWDESSFDNLILGGLVKSVGQTKAWGSTGPTDGVTVQMGSSADDKLRATALTDLIVYDDTRDFVDITKIIPILDTQGRAYPTEVKAISRMTSFDLFQEILVNRCGFANYKTNLDKFPVQRYDCALGHSLYDALKGYIGMYNPLVYQDGHDIWIRDVGNSIPAGFPAPIDITVKDYKQLQSDENRERIDALLVYYNELENDYDYTTFRFEDTTQTAGDAVTSIHKIFIQYRRRDLPYAVVREVLNSVHSETEVGITTVATSDEDFIIGPGGLIQSRHKIDMARLPDLDLSTDDSVGYTMQNSSEETEEYIYAQHPFNRSQKYCVERDWKKSGLILRDSTNLQFGQPFESEYAKAVRSGNAAIGMTTRFGDLESRTETATPLRNGTVQVRVIVTDVLADHVLQDYTEERPGDVGVNSTGTVQKRILVFDADDLDRNLKYVEDLHVGEIPLTIAIALARRNLIIRKTKPKRAQVEIIGHNRLLRKGSNFVAKGRAPLGSFTADTIGTFVILSRKISGNAAGISTSWTTRQI